MFSVIIYYRIGLISMIGNIVSIVSNEVKVKLTIDISSQTNLIGIHVIFEDGDKKIVGEIKEINADNALISIVGEIKDNVFIPGINKRPAFKSKVRIIVMEELSLVLGDQKITDNNRIFFGLSAVYSNYRINVDINRFFSNHFTILGNTGSGKSSTTARIFQNVFSSNDYVPVNARIMIFDAYGEYVNAFSKLSEISPALNYKVYTTNVYDQNNELLRIPLWLLGVDDIALLLEATEKSQLSIIERALKLVPVFKNDDEFSRKCRNDIIARAILDVLHSNKEASRIRDQITAILTTYNTPQLNLDSIIYQPGYNRPLKQCIYVDKSGKMMEMELVVDFINAFIDETIEIPDPDGSIMYTLEDLQKSLDFAIISEGSLQSEKVFDYANILAVRLRAIISSTSKEYFNYPEHITRDQYLMGLYAISDNVKAQVIDFNINYVNDRLAKTLTKIVSKMVFDYACFSPERGKVPTHIIIEEAHRYVQADTDLQLFGYNIFDRITKEGRKYGVILGLITQRPSELSETAVSQCSNFIILRTLHPKDIKFIREMVPNMTEDGIKQLKTLQPGNALAFGTAFNVPTEISFERPDPAPLSSNSDIVRIWFGEN